MTAALDRYKNQSYTGENRCTPCTAVNVVLAAALGLGLGVVAPPIGAAAFVVGLGSIYFRGYLVPGTPELTKRYFPDWLLAKFDKVDEPPVGAGAGPSVSPEAGPETESVDSAGDEDGDTADSAVGAVDVDDTDDTAVERARDAAGTEGIVDPQTLLLEVDVVEECADRDDLCLTDAFAEEWTTHAERLRDDADEQRAAIAELFDLQDVALTQGHENRFVVTSHDEQFNAWVTEGALVADLAAASVIADRTDWGAILPAQRVAILRALRSFLDVCPMCGGDVRMTEDTVDSCCRSWDVLAVRCADCDTHFLELNPERLGGASDEESNDDADELAAAEDAAGTEVDADVDANDDQSTDGDETVADDQTANGGGIKSVDPGFTRE
ncbi:MAG: hypothetical protein ABEH81_06290 [Halopenitus sp.]